MFCVPEYHQDLSLRLSEVLDEIGVNERMLLKMRRLSLVTEALISLLPDRQSYFFGSHSEGTTTIGLASDLDYLYIKSFCNLIQDYAEWQQGCVNLLMIRDDETAPGYCKLQLIRSDLPLPVAEEDCIGYNKYWVRDANGAVLLKTRALKMLAECVDDSPAIEIKGIPNLKDRDMVPAFSCKSWPFEARDWLHRSLGAWPTAEIKRFAANSGFMVVAVGSKNSQIKGIEYRISTSLAERYLMFSLNITQIRCYVLMKMFLKTYIHRPVTSFMCKTVLLHCIERSRPNKWRENNLIACLLFCLQQLDLSVLHSSCPHFIIHKNNLMAGKFLSADKARLRKSMHFVMENIGHALLGVQIDELSQRLQLKMYTLNQRLPSASFMSPFQICLSNAGIYVNMALREIFTVWKESLWYLEECAYSDVTVVQYLYGILFKYFELYMEGDYPKKIAVRLIIPLVCSTIGSVLASSCISLTNTVSSEAINWLSAGMNSDVSSGKLKLASVLYCGGDFARTELILRETERLYLDSAEPICGCCSIPVQRNVKSRFLRVCFHQNEQAVRSVCAFCVRFIQTEVNCIPRELQYELLCSIEDDLTHRKENRAVVDSLPFLYFLQYKTYTCLHRYNDQRRALINLVRTIFKEKNFSHRETALNLLGQCMEQENCPNDAFTCYRMSLNIRERNNAARIHICKLLARVMNRV